LATACTYLRADVRLLTLTGPPGAGKTRMALEIAAKLDPDFDDAVVFVRLETVRDPQLVLPAIAGSLAPGTGAGPMSDAELAEYLRSRHILLVLDNFEQVLGAARGVAELVGACPTLKVLVTSRASLRLRVEQELPIPPLALPQVAAAERAPAEAPGSSEALAAIAAAPAVQLFVQRARALRPGFGLRAENGAVIGAICARLDGLPLAIELAAARGKALSPAEILKRLGRRLELLSSGAEDLPPRQRTLRAALDWSHELLNADEQRLFRHFGVFAGGATLRTLSAVDGEASGRAGDDAAAEDARLDLVTSLVDWSLLTAEHGANTGETRYRMLEVIREYALLQLEAKGELATVRQLHASHYAEIAVQAEAALSGPDQALWLERLKGEHENMRAALDWFLDSGNPAPGLQLVCALERFWILGGHFYEGRRWVDRLLAADPAAPAAARAKAHLVAGLLADQQGEFPAAQAQLEASLALGRQPGSARETAAALGGLARVHQRQGDHATARAYAEESLGLWRQLHADYGIAGVLFTLGRIAYMQGEYGSARARFSEALAIYREQGDAWNIALTLNSLGLAARAQADYGEARQLLEESLALFQRHDYRGNLGMALNAVGVVRHDQGDYDAARAFYEQSLEANRELGNRNGVASALSNLGRLALVQEDYAAARAIFEESLPIEQELRDRPNTATTLHALGLATRGLGDATKARAFFEAALEGWRAIGDRRGTGYALIDLASLAQGSGNLAAARAMAAESLTIRTELGDKNGIAECLRRLARLVVAEGDSERAARLFGAEAALRSANGFRILPAVRVDIDERIATVRRALGEAAFAAAWTAGQALPIHEAIALALEAPAELPVQPRVQREERIRLTAREREITVLIARGMTNREIADALVITKRTADTHVSNILNRLGVSSRAQVAVWAAEHGLLAARPVP
jgi:predicted ATPase/DNA-binding NarL/FixJ family response regulator/uncharacterized protein HemY